MMDFGKPTGVLKQIGLPDSPMVMNKSDFNSSIQYKIKNSEIFQIPEQVMSNLPSYLDNPKKVIMLDDTKYLIEIEPKDVLKRSIIIETEVTPKGTILIPKVMEKDEFDKLLQKTWQNMVYARQ